MTFTKPQFIFVPTGERYNMLTKVTYEYFDLEPYTVEKHLLVNKLKSLVGQYYRKGCRYAQK